MKRRTFLLLTGTATLAVISVPVFKYFNKSKYDPLIIPDELSNFCDERTILEIGAGYRKLMPQESEKKKLTELLLTDFDGKLTPASDESMVSLLVNKKIRKDFLDKNIHVIGGWVISTTEARQCALFSLS